MFLRVPEVEAFHPGGLYEPREKVVVASAVMHPQRSERLGDLFDARNDKLVYVFGGKQGGGVFTDAHSDVFEVQIAVVGIRQGEITYDIPIEYYSIPQSLGMIGDPPREINVRLRGSQRFLSSLNPDQIRVRVDLSRTHVGNNQVSLSESDMNVPSGITVTHFYPRKINIQLSEQGRTNMKK